MAADTELHAEKPTDAHVGHGHDDHGAHPTERQYWLVFAALFALTGLEVAWSYTGLEGVALWLPLIVMMIAKFLLVAGAFMHLYFDRKILHGGLFTWAFGGSLLIALSVYVVVFFAFDVFS